MKTHRSSRVRVRAHAVLLSAKGYSIKQISDILEVSRESVSSWLTAWEESGADGLEEESSPGRPRKLTEADEQRLQELMQEDPRNVTLRFRYEYEQEHGESVSGDTIRRFLRKSGAVWKRVRKSLRDKRDEIAFCKAQRQLKKLVKRADRDEIHLYYFDEAAFSLDPTVPYGWQQKGETVELPTSGGPAISVLGFLKHDSTFFHCLTLDGSVDSSVVRCSFDSFFHIVRRKQKPIFVVLDNAPTHRSSLFMEKVAELLDQGVKCFFLPPYSPELNRIEVLWRFVKNYWLPLSAYRSLKTLRDALSEVLTSIGDRYQILFA